MDIIEMQLDDEPFNKIRLGEKRVEIRLYDEKRRLIKVGDKITFYRRTNNGDSINAIVKGLYRFNSFKELFLSGLFRKTGSGNLTAQEAAESMYKYYTREQEEKYGVLAIEIEADAREVMRARIQANADNFCKLADEVEDDEEYDDIPDIEHKALKFCMKKGYASVSLIQSRFPIGYSEANRIIDWMAENGYITARKK